jgi:AAA domain
MFDRTAATEHLRWAFGDNAGYLALGLLNRTTGKMTHRFYKWPTQRGRAIADMELMVDHAGDRRIEIFYCPLLRSRPERSADNTPPNVRVVWVDIDKPIDDDMKQRLMSWGARLVSSGTPGNFHVYFKLNRELTAGEHRGLNIALREMLGGDPKLISSNALLRVPGTVNHKTTPPRGVTTVYACRRTVPVERLTGEITAVTGRPVDMTAETVRVPRTAASAWRKVPVRALLRRGAVRSLVRMDAAVAIERWGGKRYAAVNAVVGDLIDMGLTDDQIHTLMDEFPAAVEKQNDERGYDVHVDVARIIAKRMHRGDGEAAGYGGGDGDGDDGVFESVPETGLSADAWKIVQRKRAEREANHFIAAERFNPPPDAVTVDAGTALATPPTEHKYVIDRLAQAHHNVIITAQYKTGKTTFLCNVARSLTEGSKFLGEFEVNTKVLGGGGGSSSGGGSSGTVVGHWNIEMDADELMDDYVRPAEFKVPANLYVASLRGYAVNLMTDTGKSWAVEWLASRGVRVWTIDSLARVARMAGVSENDNDEMLGLFAAIDEVKVAAGVPVCFVITHTGRAIMEEGSERARGATAIDDWPDARWTMTRDGSLRYLAVDGRGVGLPTTRVDFDESSKRYVLGSGGRAENKFAGVMEYIQKLIGEAPGKLNTRAIIKEAQRGGPVGARNRDKIMDALKEGVECGFFVTRPGTRANEKLWWPAGADSRVDSDVDMAVDGGKKTAGGATAVVLDMSRGRRSRGHVRG